MLTIAVSSRSLFDLEEANQVFEREHQRGFDEYMQRTENDLLNPGAAFGMVRKLLALNSGTGHKGRDRVQVVLLSRNSTSAGMRVMNSVHAYGLDIEQALFTCGSDRFKYAQAMNADLFLCATPGDARKALENGVAAASIVPGAHQQSEADTQVRIALDGDSVFFCSEADEIYRQQGLGAFRDTELLKAQIPLGAGPFKHLLTKLCELQKTLPPEKAENLNIALFTARGLPSHGRPISTLRAWDLSISESFFLAGRPKGPFLAAYGADMFFDDTGQNIESASEHGVPAGRVHAGGEGIVAEPV
ncbi:5'-nucleotidase [Paucibacter soli]|uniref:5'-nucleotidase n=1 Tax=Paucibacter soli TaxID=3133433 RepID=UPI00309858C4